MSSNSIDTEEQLEPQDVESTTVSFSNMSDFLGKDVSPLTNPRTEEDIDAIGISVPKEERALLKATEVKTYEKLKEKAEEGIKSTFSLLKPINKSSSVKDFKDIYGVLTRVKELKQSMTAHDMEDVFKTPSSFTGDLPSDDCSSLDLFKDSGSVTLDTVKRSNKFYYLYGKEYHAENIKWSGEKLLNSCDSDLKDKILEETQDFKSSEKGGPVYYKIMMDFVIATSDTAMRSVVNRINDLKLSDFDGENVLQFGSYIRGALLLLKNHNAVPHDMKQLVYKGLKVCSCSEFTEFITAMQNVDKLGSDKNVLDTDEVIKKAEKEYTDLLGRNEWTPKSVKIGQESSFLMETDKPKGTMCYNCGSLDHLLKNCPLPFNQDVIDKRKAILSPSSSGRGQGGRGRGRGRGGRGRGGRGRSGGRGSGKGPKDPKKAPPGKDDPREKDFNGETLHWCGRCGEWLKKDHTCKTTPSQSGTTPEANIAFSFAGATARHF